MKRILVIEDEKDLADLLADLLRLQGYDVAVAYDGKEGLAKIAAERFDLVITDLMMPVMSGWDVLDELANDPEHNDTPIIIASAGETQDTARKYGHAFVPKPFEIGRMLSTIDDLIGAPAH